jgi:hypothetical protein
MHTTEFTGYVFPRSPAISVVACYVRYVPPMVFPDLLKVVSLTDESKGSASADTTERLPNGCAVDVITPNKY